MLGRVIQLVPPAHLPDALVALRPSLLQLAASTAAAAEAPCLHAAHAWAALVASSAAGMRHQDAFTEEHTHTYCLFAFVLISPPVTLVHRSHLPAVTAAPWPELAGLLQHCSAAIATVSSSSSAHTHIDGLAPHRMWLELVYALLTGPLSPAAELLGACAAALPAVTAAVLALTIDASSSALVRCVRLARCTLFAIVALMLPRYRKAEQREFVQTFGTLLATLSPVIEQQPHHPPPQNENEAQQRQLQQQLELGAHTRCGDRFIEALSAATFALKSGSGGGNAAAARQLLPAFLQWARTAIAGGSEGSGSNGSANAHSSSAAWSLDVRLSALEFVVEYARAHSGQVKKSAALVAELMGDCARVAAAAVVPIHEVPAAASAAASASGSGSSWSQLRPAWAAPWLHFTAAIEALTQLIQVVGERKAAAPLTALVTHLATAANVPFVLTRQFIKLAVNRNSECAFIHLKFS